MRNRYDDRLMGVMGLVLLVCIAVLLITLAEHQP
jgi:hypothetical protein